MKQIRLAKSGYNAITETDPNNFIFHSAYNTFKILKHGYSNITYSGDGVYTVGHGLADYSPTSFTTFMSFPDGYTSMLVGSGQTLSRDVNWQVRYVYVDSSNVGLTINRLGGSATSLTLYYFIYETPLT